jgi:hypothetical protein
MNIIVIIIIMNVQPVYGGLRCCAGRRAAGGSDLFDSFLLLLLLLPRPFEFCAFVMKLPGSSGLMIKKCARIPFPFYFGAPAARVRQCHVTQWQPTSFGPLIGKSEFLLRFRLIVDKPVDGCTGGVAD